MTNKYKEVCKKIGELEVDLRNKIKELQDEIKVKINELEEAKDNFHNEYIDQLNSWLTLELINQTCPDHDRSSCNDNDLSNGFIKENHTYPQCHRCYLLRVLKEPYLLDDNVFLKLIATKEE